VLASSESFRQRLALYGDADVAIAFLVEGPIEAIARMCIPIAVGARVNDKYFALAGASDPQRAAITSVAACTLDWIVFPTNYDIEFVSDSPNLPLSGIVVLGFGQVFQGPYATLLMAKAGADVIKIDPPHGDPCAGAPRRARARPSQSRC
jgi:hypothetical protein